jgi:hypothetical protein
MRAMGMLGFLLGSVAAGAWAGGAPLPPVESQPLLAHVARLGEALEQAGSPWPAALRTRLAALAAERDDARVAARVQAELDPFCVAEVRIPATGPVRVRAMQARVPLAEREWRAALVKVINEAGVSRPLRVRSPNAKPLPEAPAAEVADRWLELEPLYRRPLSADLSGLALEYRVVLLSSSRVGAAEALLEFDAGVADPRAPKPIRAWDFRRDADGWQALSDCFARAADGLLRVTCTGSDPYLAAPVRMPAGQMRVRLRLKTRETGIAQVFWATEARPQFDGSRQAVFAIQGGDWAEYSVGFTAEGDLTQLRLDPGAHPGEVEIAWIELVNESGAAWAGARVLFETEPSHPVRFRVRDERGRPTTAAFQIRDDRGRLYPTPARRLAPDLFFQPQIYRADGETLRLPAGVYRVDCRRGPESVPETRTLTVAGPTTLSYQVQRWVDPAASGWWSGDHHIHAAGCAHYSSPTEGVRPEDMARYCEGEDLKVGCNLTWGPCFDFQKRFFTGAPDAASRYPYLLRYDIEVSGFGSHQSGHLCLLRLREQIYPGGASKDHWPTLGMNTLRWAKKQGAVTGPAHSAIGLTNKVGRLSYPDGPDGLPSFAIPAFDGIGAMEYIADVTHEVPGPDGRPVPAVDFLSTMNTDRHAELNIWYHTLNCGYRTRISGETDFPCITGDRVGRGRSYVKVPGRLTFDAWCDGIRDGRAYVSDGFTHLLDFRVNGLGVGEKGSELRLDAAGVVRATARVAARWEGAGEATVEVVVNGYPVARETVPANGRARDLSFAVPLSRSSWVALRVLGRAHTNPVFVLVGGRPIRADARSAEWCLRGVDQCWSQKRRFIAPAELADAEAVYEHARRAYRRILAESR